MRIALYLCLATALTAAELQIQVRDTLGEPLENFNICLGAAGEIPRNVTGLKLRTHRSGGLYLAHVEPGEYMLTVRNPKVRKSRFYYPPQSLKVTVPEGQAVVPVAVTMAGVRRFRVVGRVGGLSVDRRFRYLLSFEPIEQPGGVPPEIARTAVELNGSGGFVAPGLPRGTYELALEEFDGFPNSKIRRIPLGELEVHSDLSGLLLQALELDSNSSTRTSGKLR